MKYIETVISFIITVARLIAGNKKKPENCGCNFPDGSHLPRPYDGRNRGGNSRHRGDTDILQQKNDNPNFLNMTGWALLLCATIRMLVG